ncbi:MAG: hypothetical protein WCI67_21180 [Chloroflexales bacterium]
MAFATMREDGMDTDLEDPAARLRLLECWLPLAHAESERCGWGYAGPALEQLILRAAPALRQAPSLLAARAILWYSRDPRERAEPRCAATTTATPETDTANYPAKEATMRRRRHTLGPILTILLASLLASILSGCAKVHMGVTVNSDGSSGTIAFGIGLTPQGKALLESQGTSDPISTLLSSAAGTPAQGVSVRRWADGDYDWGEGSKTFTSLDELTLLMQGTKGLTHFTITRQTGLLKERFTLDAEAAPMNADMPNSGSTTGIDSNAFLQMRFTAKLPGTIIENSGAIDASDPTTSVWMFQPTKPTVIHMVTEQWNWRTIIGVLVGGGLLLASIGGGLALWLRRKVPDLPSDAIKSSPH